MTMTIRWRGEFENAEVNTLYAEAFELRPVLDGEWNWRYQVSHHSLGWVTARDDVLVGFVNVIWDGLVHAWIQDAMLASGFRHRDIGTKLVHTARDACKQAGCECLHVDFDGDLKSFYYRACGFTPTAAGIIDLT